MDRKDTEIPAIVLHAAERLAREDASGASALDDFAAEWDTYRVAHTGFLAGIGWSSRNATKVAVGNRTRLVRLPLKGLRGLRRVNDLRFGIQSAVPKPWSGGHDLKVTLRVSNIQLVP